MDNWKSMLSLLAIIVVMTALFFLQLGFMYIKVNSIENEAKHIVSDTVRDTVFYKVPVPVDSVVIRYKTVRVNIHDTVTTEICDTVIERAVETELPITQKEYRDSDYRVWVSGFEPSLDSIQVYRRTITNTVHIRNKWGIGIQVGAGYDFASKRVGPYVGIGVTYNFMTF